MKQVLKNISPTMIAAVLLLSLLSIPSFLSPVEASPAETGVALAGGRAFEIFPTTAITSNTRKCAPGRNYNTVDLQYVISSGVVNTATLLLEYSNDGINFQAGPTVTSTISINGSGSQLKQYPTLGALLCINATVVNTNPVTITVRALGK